MVNAVITADSIWRGWWGIARIAVVVHVRETTGYDDPVRAYNFLRWIAGRGLGMSDDQ